MENNQEPNQEMEQTPAENQPEEARQFTPEPVPEQVPEPTPETNSAGPIVGIIVIVILIVLAGFYFWGSSLQNTGVIEAPVVEEAAEDAAALPTEEASASVGAPLSGSDEIADLETDLDTTDLENLDAELADIEAELTF